MLALLTDVFTGLWPFFTLPPSSSLAGCQSSKQHILSQASVRSQCVAPRPAEGGEKWGQSALCV